MTIEQSRLALEYALQQADEIDLSVITPQLHHTSWSLAPDALRFVSALCSSLLPRHILEFGSGISTQVLQWSCKRFNPDCMITSIDHDPEYAYTAAPDINSTPDRQQLEVIIAPLVARKCADIFVPVYHLGPRVIPGPVDLVILDAPPMSLGGRLGILYQAMGYSRKGTVILLDDTDRKEEKEYLDRWSATLGDAIEIRSLPGFERGMTAVLVHDPVDFDEVNQHRIRITASELLTIVPLDSKMILVDDGCWNNAKFIEDWNSTPFLERDGEYFGPPANDETAIKEFERLRVNDAKYIVFGWPAFWWLQHYTGFHNHLDRHYQRIMDNGRLVAWDVQKSHIT